LNRGAERIESLREARIHGPTRFCQMQPLCMTLEQRRSKPLLQRLDLVGNGGRRDAESSAALAKLS
jgi:hypothetical protein